MMNKQVMLWRMIREYGLGWTAVRLFYELQVRSGFTALRFRQRPWADNELAHWLSPGVPSDPNGYAAYWQQHRQPFFFHPANRSTYVNAPSQIMGEARKQALLEEAQQILKSVP